jgi:hypothetical protein
MGDIIGDGNDMLAPGEKDDYRRARPVDHLVCSFDCGSCAFFRLKGRPPILDNYSDARTLRLIHRANLDAFWSRKRATVRQQLGIFKEQVAIGEKLGITMILPRRPFPTPHDFVMRMITEILLGFDKRILVRLYTARIKIAVSLITNSSVAFCQEERR